MIRKIFKEAIITKANNNENDKIGEYIREYLMNVEQLPCGVAVVKNDFSSTVIEANSTFYGIIGHNKEQFKENCGNRMSDILIDNFYETIKQQPTEKDYDIKWDLRLRKADGTVAWIHDCVHYNASLNLFFIIITDITDKMIATARNLSYDAFQTRNQILSDVALYASEHITVVDAETDEVVYMNPSVSKLFGFYHERDWIGKFYWKIGFGSKENVPSSYYEPLKENEFTHREYYNPFHKMYVRAKSKIITVHALNRKMRINIITDVTAQTKLEHKIALQKTLHKCIESLFTAGTTYTEEKDAYHDILKHIKAYYHADASFFYKFKSDTHEVEEIYKVFGEGVKISDPKLPMMMSDEQIKLMQTLSVVKSSNMENTLNSFSEEYKRSLLQHHLDYNIDNFACIAINDKNGNILAFIGVSNPQTNEDDKELMELLSRFICMFIEHKKDDAFKEEAQRLESISETNLVETSTKNFQNLINVKESVEDTLDTLCRHYDADFAVVLSKNDDGSCSVSYIGGKKVPDLAPFLSQASYIMEGWIDVFEKQPQFASDVDFVDLTASTVKKILHERFGIYNFIVSPIQDTNGSINGLLFVNNYKLLNRSRLMIHVVAKDISDYLERIAMHQQTQLEPATKLLNKIATQKQITDSIEKNKKGTLFIIDIDNFKGLNDTLGHQFGDLAIVDIANILKKIFRSTDIIGRVGGDEFMIFCPELTEKNSIIEKANKLLENCNRHYQKEEILSEISASIGIRTMDESCESYQCLYEKADHALYISKYKGKNRYYIYTANELDLENRFKRNN